MSKEFLVFTAQWCVPCKQYTASIKKMVKKIETKGFVLKFIDIEADQNHPMVNNGTVKSVPMTVLVVDGQTALSFAGKKTESEILSLLK